jgi:hypothetical protein
MVSWGVGELVWSQSGSAPEPAGWSLLFQPRRTVLPLPVVGRRSWGRCVAYSTPEQIGTETRALGMQPLVPEFPLSEETTAVPTYIVS